MKLVYEHIQINEDSPFKVSIFKRIKFNYPFHFHPHAYEITLTLGCDGYRIIGDHFENFGKADLALIGPGLPHGWNTYDPKIIHSSKAQVIVIQFSHSMLKGMEGMSSFEPIKLLLEKSLRGITFTGQTLHKAGVMILKMEEKQSMNEYLSILNLLHFLSTSDEAEIQCSLSYSYRGNEFENEVFGKVYKYILSHYTQPIKIKEVADIANLSESAFSHYFKKRMLKSFSEFILEIRVSHSKRLLMSTDKSIAEVAYESGFNNISNFNRLFKKVTHKTPRQIKFLNQLEHL